MDNEEIRQRLKARGISQKALAEALGIEANKVTKSLKGERRFTVPEMDGVRALLGDAPESAASPRLRELPIIGQVAAGDWREAIQHPIGRMPAPSAQVPGKAFVLEVAGNSMDLIAGDGSSVIVDPEDKALYPGRLFVIINADGETTFKRYEGSPARLVPCSTDESHKEILIGSEGFEVVGRVIWSAQRH